MTPQTTPDAYIGYLDATMNRYAPDNKGGSSTLLEGLGDRHSASAIANTIMHDNTDGAFQIKDAANDLVKEMSPQMREKYGLQPIDRKSPPTETWALVQRIHDHKLGPNFRAKLKEQWKRKHPEEEERNDYLSYQYPEAP